MTPIASGGLLVVPARGVGEIRMGDDLVAELLGGWDHAGIRPQDGDVLVVTSKVVSKTEGRVVEARRGTADKEAAVTAGTDREVARRGATRIVRTHHGFVMAAAGVDSSNVDRGSLVLLPLAPDESARRIREGFQKAGAVVGVVVSDTAGRAWRTGQTDIALGAAGLVVLDDHLGRVDPYGNALAVTTPAVADEVASAAELATGKLAGSPACLVRGLDRFVLPAGEHGSGAAALVRPEPSDMFGLGAREAVTAAVTGRGALLREFGAPAAVEDVVDSLRAVLPHVVVRTEGTTSAVRVVAQLPADSYEAGRETARLEALLRAHGWVVQQATRRAVVAVAAL
jgi:coenzyme F420-0:L-glutamate ligase / coenzyme F420-1:gamma-L-glutamate ligase